MENDAGSSQQSTNGWQGRYRERRAAVLQGAARHAAQRANDGLVVISSRLPYGLAIILRPPPADRWPDHVRLSDIELQFVCKGGKRGADVRPDFTGRLKASQAARSSCQDFIFQMWKVS
jgi:hypothetical protein